MIRLKRQLKLVLFIALIASTASCGWVLRGTQVDETLAISQLAYESAVSNGLSRLLNQHFRDSSAEGDEYLLTIVNEIQIERTQSLTPAMRSNQLRMEKRVQYNIQAIHGGRVETGTALTWRDLDQDEFTPSSTEREKAYLQEEIDEEIVAQLLRHMERFAINNAGDIEARRRVEEEREQNAR